MINGYGFATWNKLGERTSWGENRTLQLYEEMEFAQTNPASFPGNYRPFVNYSLNGTFIGASGSTIFQNRILGQQDATTVMEFPELNHINKEDFFISVYTDGTRKPSLVAAREFRSFLFSQCPAWGFRILKAGDMIGRQLTGGALATTTTIALDCSSSIISSSFKYIRLQVYIKGEV
jgi:hypothetical protein